MLLAIDTSAGTSVAVVDREAGILAEHSSDDTRKHAEVKEFVTPETFKEYERIAYAKGFLMVSASPLTRSSYHAGDDFARLRAARLAQQGRVQ